MSRPYFTTEVFSTGTGAKSDYTFPFKITRPEQLLIVIQNASGNELKRFRGDDAVEVQTLSFDPFNGGGTVILPTNLVVGYKLGIFLDDSEPIQDFEFRNKTAFTMRRFEDALDNLGAGIQTLMRRMKKVITLGDFENSDNSFSTRFPLIEDPSERVLLVNEDGITLGPKIDDVGAGSMVPIESPAPADYLTFDETLKPIWEGGLFSGYSARFNTAINAVGLRDAILQIFNFTYLGPLIGLSASPSQTVREKGAVVGSVALSASTTKRTNNITDVKFYRGGVLIHTEISPAASGGVETYSDNTPFSDTTTFYSQVNDGTSTVQSNNVTYPFVYPYYAGAGDAGLDASGIVGSLTKMVIASSSSIAVTSSPILEAFYFVQPASYPVITSILDPNGFETISGYTTRFVDITGLDGSSQSYRVYESGITTQTNFTNTYKR